MNLLYLAQETDPSLIDALQHAGHTLRCAATEQYDHALRGDYSFIVLDLPRASPRLLQRCLQRRGHASVLVLLGDSDHQARIEALKAGADVCLSRPVSAEELQARMQALTRQAPPPANDSGAGLWLSNNRLLLGRGARQQSVTVTEQRLLALLAVQASPISRQAIEQHLWGDEAASRGPLIERHICNLRRKLADLGAPYALQTLRGYGYCLNDGLRVRTD